MMETMIPPQVGWDFGLLKKKEKGHKKEKAKKMKKMKMREKREGGMLLCFSTLVLQSSTMIFMIESLLFCHFHY